MHSSNSFNYSIAETTRPFWIWGPLLFTAFYFLPLISEFQQLTIHRFGIILACYIAFLGLYRQAVYQKGDAVIPWLIALLALISFTTYFTYGSNALFGYCAFIASYNLTLRKSLLSLFIITAAILVSGYFFAGSHPYFFMPALLITWALWQIAHSTKKDAIHHLKEAKSQQTIEQLAAIAERERIARDLHDLVGHSLSSIALKAELADKYIAAEQPLLAQKEISEVANLSREMLSEVRHAVSGMKKQKIVTSLARLEADLISQKFNVSVNNSLPTLPEKLESTLVLILTEATTNILRHSTGNEVTFELVHLASEIQLTIIDNGNCIGLQKGNGLNGITERCQQLNGTLTINTEQGFKLVITLPYKEST